MAKKIANKKKSNAGVKTNKVLRGALSDAASKDALVQALKAIASELETKK